MDKLRADFEADFENETGWSAGDYPSQEVVDLCWRLYQQSRASIVVDIESHTEFEIEHMISPEKEGYSIGWIDGRNYAAKQVRSIGLSIKGE